MTTRKFLIAGGNPTALVQGCPLAYRDHTAGALLRNVEQVGFIQPLASPPHMEMMGGEFCLNASLAFASTLGPTGNLSVSGLNLPATYANPGKKTRISVPIHWVVDGNIVLLEGIGFVLHPHGSGHCPGKQDLADFCARFNLPAFGSILFSDNTIFPTVLVPSMDSFVPETACGSGSVAFSLFTGEQRVRQPSGDVIAIRRHPATGASEKAPDLFDIEAVVQPVD